MSLFDRMFFYSMIIYPVIGFVSIVYFEVLPYNIVFVLLVTSFVYKFGLKKSFIFPKYLQYYTLYVITVFVSTYFLHDNAFQIDAQFSKIILYLLPVFIFLIIENTTFSVHFIITSRRIITYLIFVAAFVSIIQYFNPRFLVNTAKYTLLVRDEYFAGYARRIMSIFTWGELSDSRYIAIGFVSFYGILIYEYKNKKLLSSLLPILTGIVILFYQSRIAMLTYLITTLFLVFNKMSFKLIIYIILILISFFLIAEFLDFDFTFFVENRIKSESALTRIDAFAAFFYAFPKNPFFGTGGVRTEALFEGYGHMARLHNAHLSIAYYYGIFAFLLHTLFLIALIRKNYITARKAQYWPPFVSILCYMTATMTMPGGEFYEPGLILMMVFNKFYFDKHLLIKASEEND
jgi:hypothetical protein